MSLDILHAKIRKLKNPSVVDFGMKFEDLPPSLIAEEGSQLSAYRRFCNDLMEHLRDIVPAVRFNFSLFALMGAEGLDVLRTLLTNAKNHGFYVLLDAPEILSPWGADRAAEGIFGSEQYLCDALIVNPFIGSDAIRPFLPYVKDGDKELFVLVHSPNKSSHELQDLLSGSRHVYDAAAELVNRFGEQNLARSGYGRVCAVTSACNGEQLRTLRMKHSRVFQMVDGLDYPSGNAKNCSLAFDRLGYGAVVCAGPFVTAAWKEADKDTDYACAAKQAAERMKKNIARYITIY